MNIYTTIETAAIAAMDTDRVRSGYCYDVLQGYQRLSGSDLRGNARHWGKWYHDQRERALGYWGAAGGCEIAVERGRRVLAVAVGADDYGNAIYQADGGEAYVQNTARQCKRVSGGD